MKRTLFLMAAIIIVAAGCNTQSFKKADGGLEYKILKGNGQGEIKYGNFLKFKVTQYYNDSLMASPFDQVAQIIQLDSTRIPPAYVKIFMEAHTGDSIVSRISTDTIAKSNPLPPYAKPHQYIGTNFKIVDVITDEATAKKEQENQMIEMQKADSLSREKQKGIDDATIQEYLKKNNINAEKTPEGTYVEVIEKGSGEPVDSGKAVSVLYKGMLLDGTVFDQSYDSTGAPKDPFTFKVGQMGAIEGWSDGMVYFNAGGKGKLFIPSARAYGSRGAGADIPPNTPIMFDVNILNVLTPDQYDKAQKDRREQMQEIQKKQMEEMMKQQQKNKPDTTK